MITDLREEVEHHGKEVVSERVNCYSKQCPNCGKVPDTENPFRRHDRRARTCWVIVDRLVHRMASFVIRYRCPSCAARFTDLPPFAFPHKRYVRSHVVELSERYTENDRATYRSAAGKEGLAIFHAAASPEEIDDRALAPSTVWRFITTLSNLKETLTQALQVIRRRSPSSSLFRLALLVAARKYRTHERKLQLESTRRLLHADREYRPLLGGSIFPGLATASGWA